MVTRVAKKLFRTRFLAHLIIIAAVTAACGKSGRVRWVNYDETVCADKWEYNMNNERLKENVVNYFDGKGIKVFELEIFSDRSRDNCADCHCKTGRRIKCKVSKRDVNDMKAEGFYE